MTVAPNFSREEILRTWHIFRQPGEVLELRIPEAGRYKTISGYFDDPGKLADAVVGLADEPFPGIYFSINPVKPELLARAANRYVKYAKNTTSDADITALHWLPIDLDAKKPAGISATDAEHAAAIAKAREIRQWLIKEQEWPAAAFVLADSGNGGHLNIKIDLPTTAKDLVEDCLAALDFLFSNETVEVDTTSGNPARIWKLYGTMVRKGDNLPERPHRLARILEVPETRETVTKEKLEALAVVLPAPEEQPKYTGQGFDSIAYCQAHNLQVHHTKSYQGGTLAVLEQCVFNPDHHLSAVIIGWPSGARTYRCRHHSCLSKRWREAREVIEPVQKTQAEHKKPTPEGSEKTEESSISEEELQTIKVEVSPPITINLEPDNFISQYINYGKYSCDAYPEYHLGMALSLLSIATNRNLVIRLMQMELFTNAWIFILGPSTIARKSVAVGLAEKLLKNLLRDYKLSESHSPEGFIEELSEVPKAYYIKDEVSSLLAAMEKPYMGEMRELLCNLYDCKGERRKLRTSQRNKKSSFEINEPYITEVCATTGESFKELTTKLDITSGWLVRFLYFYPTYRKDSRPFELANGESDLLFSSVLTRYKGIVDKLFNLTAPLDVQFEPGAFEYYQSWQLRRESELQANPDQDNIKNAVWGRLQAYALKLAVLFTVGRSDYTTETKVSLNHVTEACTSIDVHFLPSSLRVAEMVAMEETKNLQNRIISILRQHGGKIARKRLLQILHLKLSDVDDALDGLIESDEVLVLSISNKTGGKPTLWIVLNQKDINEKPREDKKQDQENESTNSSDSTDNNDSRDSRINSSSGNTPIHATIGTIETIGPIVTVDTTKETPFSSDYLDEILVCRKIKKVLSEGITAPIALSQFCGLPVCLAAKFPGVNSIAAAGIRAKLEAHRREQHFQEKADQFGERDEAQA